MLNPTKVSNNNSKYLLLSLIAVFIFANNYCLSQSICIGCADCSGCPPSFDAISSPVVQSCETTLVPTFPTYSTGCDVVAVVEQTFVASLGAKTTCEGTIANAIGAGQDLCLSLYGFSSAGLAPSDIFYVGTQSLVWTYYANGSASLTGIVYNDIDPSYAYTLDVYLEGGYNFTEWDAMGKQSLDGLITGNEADWTYFIMLNELSKLTGIGANIGETINLKHSPASEILGFQLGNGGANNINLNYGLSGWIDWETLSGSQILTGFGDINIDLVNCSETIINCASENDMLYRFYVGNVCGYDQVDIVVDYVDNTAPTWTLFPADIEFECSDTVILESPTATDLCSSVSISLVTDTIFGIAAGNYIVSRAFTATDDCGNSTSSTQTIVFLDTTPPTLSIPADFSIECSDVPVYLDATTSDLCGSVVVSVVDSIVPLTCAGSYNLIRTFTATDDAGNATSNFQTITFVDSTPPVLTVPADLFLNCQSPSDWGTAIAIDACSPTSITFVTDTLVGTCPANYTLSLTYSASDECGNISQGVQQINFSDTEPPTFGTTPVYLEVACTQEAVVVSEVFDSCSDVVTFTHTDLEGSGGCLIPSSNIVRVFNATDACGNSSFIEQTIQFIDTVAPVFITLPADTAVSCETGIPITFPTFMDVCSSVSLDYTIDTLVNTTPNDYTLSILWSASDGCGNSKTATQLIEVSDNIAPQFIITPILPDSLPFGVTVPTCESLIWSGLDNCYPSNEITFNCYYDTIYTDNGPCQGPFEIHYNYSLSDPSGNTTSIDHIISLHDFTQPVWTVIPTDFQLACHEPVEWITPEANGVLGITWDISIDTIPGVCVNTFDLIRTMTPVDGCGVSGSTQVQTLSISDDLGPTFTFIPADVTIACDEVISAYEVIASDNCTSIINVYESLYITSGLCEGDYIELHEFTAQDICGNISIDSFTVTVIDTIAPVFVVSPEDLVLEFGSAFPSCDEVNIQLTDNCSTASWSCTESVEPGLCEGSANYLRTFTASDGCGNSSTATQVIILTDTTPPEFTNFPSTTTTSCGSDPIGFATDTLQGFDLGSPNSLTFTYSGETLGGNNCTQEIFRLYTVTDACGNSYDSTHVILVVDTVAPYLSTPLDPLSFSCFNDVTGCLDTQLDIIDNCGQTSFVCNDYAISGNCDTDPCSFERIYTISDNCGNSADISQIITITTSPLDSLCDTVNSVLEPLLYGFDQPKCIPYPNPTRTSNNSGSIELLRCPSSTPWIVLNSLGNLVAKGNENIILIDNLSQGLYFLKVEGYETQRIVILK